MKTRFAMIVAMLAGLLSGCAGGADSLQERMSPGWAEIGAARRAERTARENYDQSVANYRACLAANPSSAKACDGQLHIMDANERVLSASMQRPNNTSVVVPGR